MKLHLLTPLVLFFACLCDSTKIYVDSNGTSSGSCGSEGTACVFSYAFTQFVSDVDGGDSEIVMSLDANTHEMEQQIYEKPGNYSILGTGTDETYVKYTNTNDQQSTFVLYSDKNGSYANSFTTAIDGVLFLQDFTYFAEFCKGVRYCNNTIIDVQGTQSNSGVKSLTLKVVNFNIINSLGGSITSFGNHDLISFKNDDSNFVANTYFDNVFIDDISIEDVWGLGIFMNIQENANVEINNFGIKSPSNNDEISRLMYFFNDTILTINNMTVQGYYFVFDGGIFINTCDLLTINNITWVKTMGVNYAIRVGNAKKCHNK